MAWKPASGERRCVHHSSRTGQQCRLWGIPGTEPPTCAVHGGRAPQVKAAAQRRVARAEVAQLADRVDVDLPEFASPADAARHLVDRIARRAAQFGQLADQLGNQLVYSDAAGIERLRAAVSGERMWLDSFAKVVSALAQAQQGGTRAEMYTGLRDQIIEDVVSTSSMALTNVLLRRQLDVVALGDEFRQEFARIVQWRLRDAEGNHGSSGRRPAGAD